MVLERVKAELQEKSQLQEKRNICKQRWNELAFSLEKSTRSTITVFTMDKVVFL